MKHYVDILIMLIVAFLMLTKPHAIVDIVRTRVGTLIMILAVIVACKYVSTLSGLLVAALFVYLIESVFEGILETLQHNNFILNEVSESSESDIEISVVSIEENSIGSENKSPYVVPPGIPRDIDNTTIVQRRTNEQSLQICIEDLSDGDGRAIFKESNFDLYFPLMYNPFVSLF